jgi:hypothetical protein
MRTIVLKIWPEFWDIFLPAYAIDDGNGGEIHVNVSIFLVFQARALTSF